LRCGTRIVAVTRSKQRRFHIAIDPPVVASVGERRVAFVGLNMLNGAVMVEYDIDPPLQRRSPHGPHLVTLHVTDDATSDVYPTSWEDFTWPDWGSGRTTTRLDRRPPPDARRLHIEVLPFDRSTPAIPGPGTGAPRRVVQFDVQLPPESGQPWPTASPHDLAAG
jgi:hypothetical protein